MVSFLRLHSLLVKSHPEALALNLNESESNAIYSITEILLHEIVRGKEETIRGIYTGEGEHLGVPCMCSLFFSVHLPSDSRLLQSHVS